MLKLSLILCVIAVFTIKIYANGHKNNDFVVTNEWHTVFNNDMTPENAKKVAEETGFRYVRQHMNRPNEYIFNHNDVPTMSATGSLKHHKILNGHPRVKRAVQAKGYRREKRGFKPSNGIKKGIPQREPVHKDVGSEPNDPLFKKEWYIKNTGQAEGVPNLDLNVMSAWARGYAGKGVVTAIMDDGIDYLHPDIAPNYSAESSYDFSSNDPYPYPRYTDDWFNSHGTRCAGEVVAVRDNKICGVGVAYKSKIAGLRMLDQPYMTDLIEAAAMSHDRDNIHIYSASWGPTDDGKTVDGPRNETMNAIVEGVNLGRKGKGSIYVWASGDGGAQDDCNCDGYAASMWTISINSATNDGQTASYDESCSSTLASTFSNGKAWYTEDAGVGTVDLYGNCTLHHSGTSAAAPEAAGVFALALEANPNLSWRDVQHITVLTSKRNHLYDRDGRHNWTVNGAGLEFNHLFGYGVLDGGDMVHVSEAWSNVPERFHCIAGEIKRKHHFNVSKALILEVDTDACQGDAANRVNFLEHVQAFITLKATKRGDVTLFLTSPMGTTSMILSKRPLDDDNTHGFTKWPFMTTHTWGEAPKGVWRLTATFDTEDSLSHGIISEFVLVLHGTQQAPYANIPESVSKNVPKLGVVKKQHESKRYLQA